MAKTATIVVFALVIVGAVAISFRRGRIQTHEHMEIRKLNDRYDAMTKAMESRILEKPVLRKVLKQRKKSRKEQDKKIRRIPPNSEHGRKRIFVLEFMGDVRASAIDHLREEISAVLLVGRKQDEVVLRLHSSGGFVHSYGLAASQLQRIRDAGMTLTISVDEVAASGGYLMACVGHRIIAAPFAIIGSIGVIGQLPNLHRFLKRHDVDFEIHTAGEYKRTLTVFGENTDKGREKFRQELEQTHGLFKSFIREHRPRTNVDTVATGEYWHGYQALELKLVDELRTSDDYLMTMSQSADMYSVRYRRRHPMAQRFAHAADATVGRLLSRAQNEEQQSRFYKH